MGVSTTITVTPVYWAPAGFTYPSNYQSLTTQYVADVAHDSGLLTNVFSAATQYTNASNNHIQYNITAATAINDTTGYPSSGGCTADTGAVYPDNTGYTACLTDAQIQNRLAAHSLTGDFNHLYLVFLPKGVESCSTTSNNTHGGTCTLSHGGRGTFCGYHSNFGNSSTPTLYADLPYAIEGTTNTAGYTCSSNGGQLQGGGSVGNQSPNSNIDADTVLSVTSHEMNEAITDPLGTAWFDSSGNEDGDDCAYIYGDTTTFGGSSGAEFNQTINGHHYFTQEEFSNLDYAAHPNFACVQQANTLVASKLVVTTQPPTSSTAGQSFAVGISVEDSSGNVITASSAPVTLAITSGSGTVGAALTCTNNPVNASSGVATFSCSVNISGTLYSLTASSSGPTSAVTNTFTIASRPTTTTASATPGSSTAGSSVTYGAHVAPTSGTGTPTGTVTFKVGGTTLCTTAALDGSGNGSCSATNAPVGTDTVTATYSGDVTFATSSGTTTETVSEAVTAPTNLSATAVSAHEVDLSWTGSSGATGYNVSRSTDGVNFTQVATGVTGTSYANVQYLRLPGSGTVSTPNSGALAITGDIDIRVKASLDNWTPSNYQALLSSAIGSSLDAYGVYVSPAGALVLFWSPNGTSQPAAFSTAALSFANGSTHWVRVTRGASSGVVTFYTSSDGVSWTQLGSSVSGLTGSMVAGNQPISVGSFDSGASNLLAGDVYSAEVHSGINGTVVVSPDFTAASGSSFSDAEGNTWSIGGGASLQAGPGLSSGTTYSYKVQAVGSGGTSGFSNVASATTPTG
jgi:hypothetical protein